MATSHHHRSTSGSKKPLPPHARTSKPAPLTKRGGPSSRAAHKAAAHPSRERESAVDDESMAASFLQFCATCEKQIIVPSNSLLYCSESCRKRDNKSHYNPADYSPTRSPFGYFSPEDRPVRDIIPPRSPTAAPLSNRSSLVYASDSEYEPTSPVSSRHDSNGSEAERYLRQFQHVAAVTPTVSEKPTRPRYNRSHSTAAAHSTAPSLSHTPHSVSSMAGMPFTPSLNNSRPLPPRKNPYSSSHGNRSTDLVTPFASLTMTDAYATTAPGYNERALGLKSAPSANKCVGLVAEGEISYEKRETLPVALASPGSLGRLFAGKTPPAPKWT